MNVIQAIRFLMETEEWNYCGAEEIVDTAIEDGIMLTEEKLKELSEDYKHR